MARPTTVRSFFWFKFLFLPFFFIGFVFYSLYLLFVLRQMKHDKEFYLFDQYKKLGIWFSFLKTFNNLEYQFKNEHQIVKTSCLFICNEKYSWEHLMILIFLYKQQEYPFISVFTPKLKKGKRTKLLKLINTFDDWNDYQTHIKDKYSVFCNLKGSEDEVHKLLNKNYSTITFVKITNEKIFCGKRIIIDFVKTIKSNEIFNKDRNFIFTEINKVLT